MFLHTAQGHRSIFFFFSKFFCLLQLFLAGQVIGQLWFIRMANNNCNTLLTIMVKVTVQVGTDQNIEIEIFAEYKYTLNELLVTKIAFHCV